MKLIQVFAKRTVSYKEVIEAANTGYKDGIETAQLYLSVTGFEDAADKLNELLDNLNLAKKE